MTVHLNNNDMRARTLKVVRDDGPSLFCHVSKQLTSKSLEQSLFIRAIEVNDIVIAAGSAGTGKTFISAYLALKALEAGTVKKIVITRPAKESGERIGFLPGTYEDKMEPYLRPIMDAFEFFGLNFIAFRQCLTAGTIEIAPVGYLRGRTFNDCFVLVDEAQSLSVDQMLMVLTRAGQNCKLVISGDPTQSDLPQGIESGLQVAIDKLNNVPSVGICKFSNGSIIRSRVVKDILSAWDKSDS